MVVASRSKKPAVAAKGGGLGVEPGPTDHVSHVALSQAAEHATHVKFWYRFTAVHPVLKNLLHYGNALLENTGIFNVFINIIYINN